MTPVAVERVEFERIEPLRELYRRDAGCQIIHDSILARGLADAYVVTYDGKEAAYGGVWNRYHPGRVMEFHALPDAGPAAPALFRAFVAGSGATEIEAQTNMPGMFELLMEHATNHVEEKLLFEDGPPTSVPDRGGSFRHRREDDDGPDGEWVVTVEGEVVAGGGVLTHYNPPYGDIYMEVGDRWRRRGIGSYLVRELRRVCHESGLVPGARCDPDNTASRRTLERAGMVLCGRLLAGPIDPAWRGAVGARVVSG